MCTGMKPFRPMLGWYTSHGSLCGGRTYKEGAGKSATTVTQLPPRLDFLLTPAKEHSLASVSPFGLCAAACHALSVHHDRQLLKGPSRRTLTPGAALLISDFSVRSHRSQLASSAAPSERCERIGIPSWGGCGAQPHLQPVSRLGHTAPLRMACGSASGPLQRCWTQCIVTHLQGRTGGDEGRRVGCIGRSRRLRAAQSEPPAVTEINLPATMHSSLDSSAAGLCSACIAP